MARSRAGTLDEFRLWWVARAVLAQTLPLLLFAVALWGAASAWALSSGDHELAALAGDFVVLVAVGLAGSFVVHESAHAHALARVPGVTGITVDRTLWRLSVVPSGAVTARQAAGVAVAGPLAGVVVGALLWVTAPDSSLRWWYLAHAVFLLPCFGDGRVLLGCWRARSSTGSVV